MVQHPKRESSAFVSQQFYYVSKSGKNYYPQAFVEEFQHKLKEKETKLFIKDDLESPCDDDDSEEDFEENSEKSIMRFQLFSVSSFISLNFQACHL